MIFKTSPIPIPPRPISSSINRFWMTSVPAKKHHEKVGVTSESFIATIITPSTLSGEQSGVKLRCWGITSGENFARSCGYECRAQGMPSQFLSSCRNMKSRLLTKHYLLCLISLNILLKEINSGQTTESTKQIFLMSIY